MSFDAPVLNEVLRTREDVDAVVRKLTRHVPGKVEGRYLQIAMWWYEPAESLSQKNLAQAWCGLLAKHSGCDHAVMWGEICRHLLGEVEFVNPITRVTTMTYRSSKTLRTRKDWQTFLDGIERLADEFFDLKLPPPNHPQAWQQFRTLKRVAIQQQGVPA